MEKEKKVRQKINWKKEMKLAPGYIVIILWVIFTFMLLGWILAASLSTTTDIFAGKALKFPTGLHFENYIQAWGSGGVATFFMNSMLYSLISWRDSHFWEIKSFRQVLYRQWEFRLP